MTDALVRLATALREPDATLRQDLTAAVARIAALEARPQLEHVGAWRAGTAYTPMQLVQHGGSCWLCLEANSVQPGTGPAWRLVAKRGRDGR